MHKLIPHSNTTITDLDFNEIKNTFYSGITTANSKLDLFKQKFQKNIEKEYIRLCSSGSSALYELLLAMNIGKDEVVLIPSYICSTVKNAILKTGAEVVFYDNEKNSWLSSFDEISKKITKNTKAIILNNTFGIRYEIEDIEKLNSLEIPLIQDCAHFISFKKQDIEISNLFAASFYSFNATKLLATGEGGAISTNNKDLAKELEKNRLDNGFSDLNASLGLSQLEQYSSFLENRELIADYYFTSLKDIAKDLKQYSSIYFRFPIFVKDDIKFLYSKKVAFRKGVDTILHNCSKEKLTNTENTFKRTISIPIYPSLSKVEQQITVDEVKRLYYEN